MSASAIQRYVVPGVFLGFLVSASCIYAQPLTSKKGLIVPPHFDSQRHAILFIHGLGSRCETTFADFIQNCRQNEIQALTFDYPNQGPIANAGKSLAAALNEFAKAHPNAKIVIIAHSMGGLVARYALEIVEPAPHCVSDLITIATPHGGSRLATYSPYLRAIEAIWAGASRRDILADGHGEAGGDLDPSSKVIRLLQEQPSAVRVRYHLVAGRKAFVDRIQMPRLQAEVRRLAIARFNKSSEEAERIAADLATLEEIVNGAGDGAVSLKASKLTGAVSERVFDLDHMELTRGDSGAQVWLHVLGCLGWRIPKGNK